MARFNVALAALVASSVSAAEVSIKYDGNVESRGLFSKVCIDGLKLKGHELLLFPSSSIISYALVLLHSYYACTKMKIVISYS